MKSEQLSIFENPIIGTLKGFIDEKTGEPWFLAGQVCRCLGIKDSTSAVQQLKQRMQVVENFYREKKISNLAYNCIVKKVKIENTNFGKQDVYIINEQALYELIFASRKQTAIVFRAWVTGEVLPSLRKHGEYRMNGKLIRRSLTDTIKTEIVDKSTSPNAKFNYSNFSSLINKSLGLPSRIENLNSLPDDIQSKITKRTDLVRCLIEEGKQYNEVKEILQKL
jgi:prophage antirepressor-like protein